VPGEHHLLIIHLPFVFRMREQACCVSSQFSTGGASDFQWAIDLTYFGFLGQRKRKSSL